MISTLVVAAVLMAPVSAAPVSADRAIGAARDRAAASGKSVLVRFTASWCPWCRRFDQLLADPKLGPKFAESYEIVAITVRERDEKRANENPGWAGVMRGLRGAKEQDVPYLAVVSAGGEKLGDSYRGVEKEIPSNAGFPRTDAEIEAFLGLIRRTGKSFSAEDRLELKSYFVAARTKRSD